MARTTITPVNLPGTTGAVWASAGVTSLATFTGVKFVLSAHMFLYVSVGAAGAGNVTQQFGRKVQGITPTSLTSQWRTPRTTCSARGSRPTSPSPTAL